MKKSLIYIAALTLIAACNKVESPVPVQDTDILIAQIEQETSTKTYMDAHNNIRWSEGDQIVGFMKSSLGLKYRILSSSVGKTSASFENVSGSNGNINAGTEWDHNIVYYPYADAIEAAKSGSNYTLDVVLPSEQTYAAESFGNGSMAMVAVSEDNNITFRNLCGVLSLQLQGSGTIKSITVKGNSGELLSGKATVTASYGKNPEISLLPDGGKTVTLDCGETGVALQNDTPTSFYIVLPPVSFDRGFTVTVTDAFGATKEYSTTKKNTILRSSILRMPEKEYVGERVPQEGDYIDEYGINNGQGVKIGETVWAPVNCGYHATDFKYGKLYQWGRKYGQGYDENDASVPTIEEGGISVITGQHKNKANVFFTSTFEFNDEWLYLKDSKLWNSGSESVPVKTEYDPCPEGWRVPTYTELYELNNNYSSWTTNENGQPGYWFSGPNSYTSTVPQVFFPAAGCRKSGGDAYIRGYHGYYWSSSPNSTTANLLYFYHSYVAVNVSGRAYGCSVRCVQE